METILASAATEIGKALNASRTEIRIGIRDQGAERRSNGEDPDLDLLEGLDS
jgi:hypothetical protein